MTRFRREQPKAAASFYSVAEAARILGVSPMTLYREIADGNFPAVRIRKRLIIPAGVIDELVREADERDVDTIQGKEGQA